MPLNATPSASLPPILPRVHGHGPATYTTPVSHSVLRAQAYELLAKYSLVSRSGSPLPMRDELAQTVFVRDPNNSRRAAIIFLDANGNHSRYCFLTAEPSTLTDIQSCAEVYQGMVMSQSLDRPSGGAAEAPFSPQGNDSRLSHLPTELLFKIFSYMEPKEAVGAYAASKTFQQVLMNQIHSGKAEWFQKNLNSSFFLIVESSPRVLAAFDKVVAILSDRRNPKITDGDRNAFLHLFAHDENSNGYLTAQARINDCFKVAEYIEEPQERTKAVDSLFKLIARPLERAFNNFVRLLNFSLLNPSGLERAKSITRFAVLVERNSDFSTPYERSQYLQGVLQLSARLEHMAEIEQAISSYEEIRARFSLDSMNDSAINNRIQQLRMQLDAM